MAKNHAKVKTIPPLIPLVAIILSWLLDRYIYTLPIPINYDIQKWTAYLLIIIVLILFSFSLYYFIKTKQNPDPHTPTNVLYTHGVFRFSRNPIYLGFILAQIIVAIKLNNSYVLITLPIVFWLLKHWVIKPEEVYLENLFGNQYINYKKTVRRWI